LGLLVRMWITLSLLVRERKSLHLQRVGGNIAGLIKSILVQIENLKAKDAASELD